MSNIIKKSLSQPEESTAPEKLKIETVTLEGLKVHRVTAEPGWQWSKHLRPVVGGESCKKHHMVYVVSGSMKVKMDSGEEMDFGSGDVGVVPPGHDGWTTGDVPVVWLEIPHIVE
jgi:Protein of unknown function (DUF861).